MATNVIMTLCFLVGVLAVHYCLPPGRRWIWLLFTSYCFYMSVDARMALLLAGSTLWAWFTGLKLYHLSEEPGRGQAGESGKLSREAEGGRKRRRGWLVAGILPLLGALFLFKYLNFFITSVAELLQLAGLGGSMRPLRLVMPMGISYYTFKLLSYLVDIYRGKLPAQRHPGYLAVYTSFFPQILSGPIERADVLLSQLEKPVYRQELFAAGLQRIALGLFKKLVIANRLSAYVDLVFGNPADYPALAAWMAAFFYALQIYCDFSGYSDLALGMSDCMGIRCRENFSLPYFSTGIREFWGRWHMSLSSWLRDYVYIPLGGSRVSRVRKNVNVMTTFLVSGLWHGDSWTFLFWGGLHGLWNMAGKKETPKNAFVRLRKTLVTFLGVSFCWIFFRAESVSGAFFFLKRMVTGFSLSYGEILASVLPFSGDNTCAALFLTVCLCILLLFFYELGEEKRRRGIGRQKDLAWDGVRGPAHPWWTALFLFVTLILGIFGNSSFLYAQF